LEFGIPGTLILSSWFPELYTFLDILGQEIEALNVIGDSDGIIEKRCKSDLLLLFLLKNSISLFSYSSFLFFELSVLTVSFDNWFLLSTSVKEIFLL